MFILIITLIFGFFAILSVASLPFNGFWMFALGIFLLPILPPIGIFFIVVSVIGLLIA